MDRWRHENVLDLRETQQTSKLNINSLKINVNDIVTIIFEKVPKHSLLLSLLSCELRMFVKENPYIKKANSVLQSPRTDFWSMMGEERRNALSLVCIYRDIFLDYDKIIGIYASKYPRRMLLINHLSEN